MIDKMRHMLHKAELLLQLESISRWAERHASKKLYTTAVLFYGNITLDPVKPQYR